MRYCGLCGRLFTGEQNRCEYCGKPLRPLEDDNTPVYLISASGLESERILSALSEAGIPGSIRPNDTREKTEVLYGSKANGDITVPYSAYDKAFDVLIGIGAADPKDKFGAAPDEASEESESAHESSDTNDSEASEISEGSESEQFEEMSPAKRTTIKILSAILFIIIAALVIFGTDYITGLIKGLFK